MSSTADPVDVRLRNDDRRVWRRHPVDTARLAIRVLVLIAVLSVTAAFPSALTTVSADLVRLFARIPDPIRYSLVAVAQLAMVLVPVVIVVWLLRAQTRAMTLLVVAAAVTSGLLMVLLTDWLERVAPPTDVADLPSNSFVRTDFPSIAYLAALVAGAAVATPMMTPTWRRIAWAAVWLTALVRVVSATQAPVSVAVTVALGSVIGSCFLVAFGTVERRPGSATLRAALATGGFEVDDLTEAETIRGLRSFRGTADGQAVGVFYLDRDDREAERFSRVMRSIRVRDVDEQRLSVKPRERAAQIALSTLMAERAGVSVPAVLSVAPAPDDAAVVASAVPRGQPIGELTGDDVDDDALASAWREVGLLHEHGIAHRSLSTGNVWIDGADVTLGGLDTALLGSTEESRAVDRAELLVTTALVCGVDRAVDAATRWVDADDLGAALPFVQTPALPAHAKREIKELGDKHLVEEIRTGTQEHLGVEDVELAELERISIAKVVSWIGFAVLAFFLLTLVSNWPEIRQAISGLNWVWVIPIFLATIVSTFGGAMSLSGSVVRPIPLGEATIIMFGQSFLNRFTPMNAGGMAMRIRYLQKGGTDATVATAAIGLTSLASGLLQVVFIVFFFLVSSTNPTEGVEQSRDGFDGTLVGVFVIALVVAIAVIVATPKLRRWVADFVRSTMKKIRSDFGELARRPSKMMLLFGGAALGKLATITAFAFSCWAFDVDLSFVTIGALYLAASTVASAVPTPGGVGAIEAALVFVLTGAGVDEATAWASMLLFRLINYWFPTIPGYLALRISERRGLV